MRIDGFEGGSVKINGFYENAGTAKLVLLPLILRAPLTPKGEQPHDKESKEQGGKLHENVDYLDSIGNFLQFVATVALLFYGKVYVLWCLTIRIQNGCVAPG